MGCKVGRDYFVSIMLHDSEEETIESWKKNKAGNSREEKKRGEARCDQSGLPHAKSYSV
jgi:hypothetical protein